MSERQKKIYETMDALARTVNIHRPDQIEDFAWLVRELSMASGYGHDTTRTVTAWLRDSGNAANSLPRPSPQADQDSPWRTKAMTDLLRDSRRGRLRNRP